MAPSSVSPSPLANQPAFRAAVASDAPELLRLLRATPFGRRVALTLEEDPAHRPIHSDPGRSHTVVANRPDSPCHLLGLARREVHSVWFDRQAARLGYLGQFRRQPGEDLTLRRLRDGFRLLEAHRLPDELPFDFTSILADNTAARRLLERGLPGLPRYDPIGELATLTFATSPPARPAGDAVRSLVREDHADVSALLRTTFRERHLAPCLQPPVLESPDLHWLVSRRDGLLTGCAALWDQSSFKTVTIAAYPSWLRRLRVPLNLIRGLRRSPLLPPVGQRLPLAFLSFLATAPGDLETIRALLHAASRRARELGIPCLHLGLPANHPAVPSLRKTVRPEVTFSIIYFAHPPGSASAPPAATLPIHPEIALL